MLGTTTATKDEAVPSPRNPPVLQKVFRKRVVPGYPLNSAAILVVPV